MSLWAVFSDILKSKLEKTNWGRVKKYMWIKAATYCTNVLFYPTNKTAQNTDIFNSQFYKTSKATHPRRWKQQMFTFFFFFF